jgi:chemotaxis protein methyltransferase CheR
VSERGTNVLPRQSARAISRAEFVLFQRLIRTETGISLSDGKRDLLVSRLAPRLRELGLASFADYYRRIEEGDEAERVHMLDRISTNETHFFREARHFEYLEQTVLPDRRAQVEAGVLPREMRAWSCACSTGEEPYSLAMTFLAHLPVPAGWNVRVLGTDISTRALDKAGQGVWSMERAAAIPAAYLKAFMLRGTRSQEGKLAAGEELRQIVEFRRFNLSTEVYPFDGAFDLIFCRNVLIYFDAEARRHVLEQLARCLAPHGLLFLGHAETAAGLTGQLRSVHPTVYAREGSER